MNIKNNLVLISINFLLTTIVFSQYDAISITGGVSNYSSKHSDRYRYGISNSIFVSKFGKERLAYNFGIGLSIYRGEIIPIDEKLNITLGQFTIGYQYKIVENLKIRANASIGVFFNRTNYIQRPEYYYDFDLLDYSLLIGLSNKLYQGKRTSIDVEVSYQKSMDNILSGSYQNDDVKIGNIAFGLVIKYLRKSKEKNTLK